MKSESICKQTNQIYHPERNLAIFIYWLMTLKLETFSDTIQLRNNIFSYELVASKASLISIPGINHSLTVCKHFFMLNFDFKVPIIVQGIT